MFLVNRITDNNSKKGSHITAIVLDIYKAINRAAWNWVDVDIHGDHIEDGSRLQAL